MHRLKSFINISFSKKFVLLILLSIRQFYILWILIKCAEDTLCDIPAKNAYHEHSREKYQKKLKWGIFYKITSLYLLKISGD